MATSLKIESSRADTFYVNPADVKPNYDLQGRCNMHTPESVEQLARRIHHEGQQQPAQVRKLGNGDIQLVFGYRRWLAVQWIRENLDPRFRLWVRVVQVNDKEAFIRNVSENKSRLATTPIDDARNANLLITCHGCSETEVADVLGCTVQWLTVLGNLLLLPDDIKDKVASGSLTVDSALAITKLGSETEMREVVAAATIVKDGKTKVASGKVKKAAREKGVKVGRTVADLKKVLKPRTECKVSVAILAYLKGTGTEITLLKALRGE